VSRRRVFDLSGSGSVRLRRERTTSPSPATALKRTGAMALACRGQVTKMTGGVPSGLSSSMMIPEPFTRALAKVVDLGRAGSFPV
jgi:hypothetical protein